MIKIFIESGVNDAKKHEKETTNEQDFIMKVIAKHFPKCKYGTDYEIVGTGGWINLQNLVFEFESNSDVGGTNLVIFDADEERNNGGFMKRQAEIKNLIPTTIKFKLFLWPDNKTDGDFELLLSKIVNPEHQCLLDSYEHFEDEVRRYDPNDEKYDIPGRKGEMYTYLTFGSVFPQRIARIIRIFEPRRLLPFGLFCIRPSSPLATKNPYNPCNPL